MSIYHKIYEESFGPIPKDDDGRTYEIHHRDGNHANNDINNLQCVSIQEHYDIHHSQEDWYACYLISLRMGSSSEKISELARKNSRKRIIEKNHPFLGGEMQRETQKKLVEEGKHHLLGGEIQRKTSSENQRILVEKGTHIFLGDGTFQRENNNKKVRDGTHHFLSGEIQRKINRERVENGTHHFLNGEISRQAQLKSIKDGTHITQKEYECPHCGKLGKGPIMFRYHFEKCKVRKQNETPIQD